MYDLKTIYHIICVLTTIGLVCWVSYEYSLNEDETQIHIKEFHKTSDDIYPSITVCINMPFIKEKLKEIHPNLTIGGYSNFLEGKGNNWNEAMAGIDYENVTWQLEDVFQRFEMSLLAYDQEEINDDDIAWKVKNNSFTRLEITDGDPITKFNTVTEINTTVTAVGSQHKCFTIDIPYMADIKVDFVMIHINAAVFSSETIEPDKEEFSITFGYPNQLLQSRKKNQVIHDRKVSKTTCYRLDTYLGSMEVIRRRDKSESRCNKNWQNQDEYDQNNIIKKIGCKPNFWKAMTSLPNCSTKEQYNSAAKELNRMSDSIPPCKNIEKLTQLTYEFDEAGQCPHFDNQLYLRILFNRETMYKEIRLVRAFNVQSLIGNAGKQILHGYPYTYLI